MRNVYGLGFCVRLEYLSRFAFLSFPEVVGDGIRLFACPLWINGLQEICKYSLHIVESHFCSKYTGDGVVVNAPLKCVAFGMLVVVGSRLHQRG